MSTIDSLKQQAELALIELKVKAEGKRFILSDVNDRMQQAVAEYPQDTVIRAVAGLVENEANKKPDRIICQAEIKNWYDQLSGLSGETKFKEVLSDLMPDGSELQFESTANPDFISGLRDGVEKEIQFDYDKKVENGFSKLFAEKNDYFSNEAVVKAERKVEIQLNSFGCDLNRVKLEKGNSRFLIFSADLNTPFGSKTVLIPADASGSKLPSMFVANDSLKDLNASSLSEFLQDSESFKKRASNPSDVLNLIDRYLGSVQQNMQSEEFENIISGLETSSHESLNIPNVFAELEDESETMYDVEVPRIEAPAPLKSMVNNIDEVIIESSLGYPTSSVRLAKNLIQAEISEIGFKGSQIKVAYPVSNGFVCDVELDTPRGKVNIEVPIEMNGNSPLIPSVFAKDDFISDLNAVNLKTFVMASESEGSFVNRDGNLYAMDIPDLKNIIIKSASNGDFGTCDEIMSVIADRVDEETYRGIASDYLQILANINEQKDQIKNAQVDKDQFMTTQNSIYPIHKQLGLPIHKLIRDENGEYHRKESYLARKDQEAQGGMFSNAKILLGD